MSGKNGKPEDQNKYHHFLAVEVVTPQGISQVNLLLPEGEVNRVSEQVRMKKEWIGWTKDSGFPYAFHAAAPGVFSVTIERERKPENILTPNAQEVMQLGNTRKMS